ncbi:MAG: TIM barrel protein [Candidatus Omnitrophota bacterium]
MVFGVSTAWNAYRHRSAGAIVSELEKLGFKTFELSYNLNAVIVNGFKKLIANKRCRIVSIHNFCPIPSGMSREKALPDCYSLASLDEEERRLALRYTKKTITTAAWLGAKAVVLHCGRVEIPDRTRGLIYLHGKNNFRLLLKRKNQAIQERKKAAKPFLQNALRSLEELNRFAEKNNILLGLENRFYYREIPSFEELLYIFTQFRGSSLRYWHDTGHAQVMQNLGFHRHFEYIKAFKRCLLGVHMHDIIGCNDHKAPGTGEFDFGILSEFLSEGTIKIIEAHRSSSALALKAGNAFLNERVSYAR